MSSQRLTLALVLLVVLGIGYAAGHLRESTGGISPGPSADRAEARARGNEEIARAFRERRSDVIVEAGGVVEKVLRDDEEGSRHQRLILRLGTGQTLLISHNIDLAPRVPAREGDLLDFRGEYEWNKRGGVVHWTHHDPAGRRPGGWLLHRDKIYE